MKVENLDHLGLVAGLVDEIGIVEKINELVGEYFDYAQHKQPGEIVSPGLVVKAMIINGLGIVIALNMNFAGIKLLKVWRYIYLRLLPF